MQQTRPQSLLSPVAGKGPCFPCSALRPSPCLGPPGDTQYTPEAPARPLRVKRLGMSPRAAAPPAPRAVVTLWLQGHSLSDRPPAKRSGPGVQPPATLRPCGHRALVGRQDGRLRESLRACVRAYLRACVPACVRVDRQDTAHRSSEPAFTCAARSAARPEVRHWPAPAPQGGWPSRLGCPSRPPAVSLGPLGLKPFLTVVGRWALTPEDVTSGDLDGPTRERPRGLLAW